MFILLFNCANIQKVPLYNHIRRNTHSLSYECLLWVHFHHVCWINNEQALILKYSWSGFSLTCRPAQQWEQENKGGTLAHRLNNCSTGRESANACRRLKSSFMGLNYLIWTIWFLLITFSKVSSFKRRSAKSNPFTNRQRKKMRFPVTELGDVKFTPRDSEPEMC